MSARRWKVYDGPQINPMFSGIVCMISAGDQLIAVITDDETPVDPREWSDIARLIAAAPDLLPALRGLLEVHDAMGAGKSYAADVARAAIARAEDSHV